MATVTANVSLIIHGNRDAADSAAHTIHDTLDSVWITAGWTVASVSSDMFIATFRVAGPVHELTTDAPIIRQAINRTSAPIDTVRVRIKG